MLLTAACWWKIRADMVPKFQIKKSYQSGDSVYMVQRDQNMQDWCFPVSQLFSIITPKQNIMCLSLCNTLHDSEISMWHLKSEKGSELYNSYLSMWSFWAKSCQSFPLALAVSKVALIRWRIDGGILKALDPVWEVMVQSDWVKKGTTPFSF